MRRLTMKSAAAYPRIVLRWSEPSTGREVYLHVQYLFKISILLKCSRLALADIMSPSLALEPANSIFYRVILEIKEWQNLWLTRQAVQWHVKNVVKN